MMDFAKPTEDKQIAELLLAPNEMGRPYVAPPGIPADRLQVLRRGFDAAADKALLAEANKTNFGVPPMTGEAIEKMTKWTYATPKDVVDIAKKILESD